MKTITVFILLITALVTQIMGTRGSAHAQKVNDVSDVDLKNTCRVLVQASFASSDPAEVIAYKNAHDYLKRHFVNKDMDVEYDAWFSKFVQGNPKLNESYLFTLKAPPKRGGGFANREIENLLEVIKSKEMSIDDLIKDIKQNYSSEEKRRISPTKVKRRSGKIRENQGDLGRNSEDRARPRDIR
jgi:hypothetical protein